VGSPGLEQTATKAFSGTSGKTAEMNSELVTPLESVSLVEVPIRIVLGSTEGNAFFDNVWLLAGIEPVNGTAFIFYSYSKI
jgi:hypothetical protein